MRDPNFSAPISNTLSKRGLEHRTVPATGESELACHIKVFMRVMWLFLELVLLNTQGRTHKNTSPRMRKATLLDKEKIQDPKEAFSNQVHKL